MSPAVPNLVNASNCAVIRIVRRLGKIVRYGSRPSKFGFSGSGPTLLPPSAPKRRAESPLRGFFSFSVDLKRHHQQLAIGHTGDARLVIAGLPNRNSFAGNRLRWQMQRMLNSKLVRGIVPGRGAPAGGKQGGEKKDADIDWFKQWKDFHHGFGRARKKYPAFSPPGPPGRIRESTRPRYQLESGAG